MTMEDFDEQLIKGYELRERIGAGGSGLVYRAFQPLVGRDVAIKIILPQYANHPDFIRRFENEAQLVARLEHPHIVPLYDYWRDPNGAFLVMRWLKGGSLQQAIDQQPLSLEMLVHMFEQILPALAIAHRHEIVHRDLKPANILLDEDQNAYLADFGIAKDLGNRNSAYQTQTGVLGSPAYLSPEQIYSKPVTSRTDIYSLGVLMYEALVGELPFQETSLVALLYKHMNEPLPAVRAKRPDLPEAVDVIIQRASAKSPDDRYANVGALLADLRAITHQGSTALLPPLEVGGSMRSTPTDRRRRTSGVIRHETGFETMVIDLGGMIVDNPYKGLRAFHEADAMDFFGREVLTQHLLNKLAEPGPLAHFLAVVGPSGSGKSSVVRAGVIPALRKGAIPNSDHWFIIEMLPGTNPLVELEAALLRVAVHPPDDLLQQISDDDGGLLRVVKQILPADPETELVLVIDQFEEVFTQVADEAARDRLIYSIFRAVTTPYSRLRVIVTLRADFYDRPLMYPQVSELFRQRTEVVVPLNDEELERAIVQPAAQAGLILEAELIAAMINDVGAQPGALPLLQYALTELVERRSGRVLTLASYRDSGGVLGALARRADELYEQLSPDEQDVARQMFLRLVTLGEGTEDTRRRVQQNELSSIAGSNALLEGVINAYYKYRLLSFDRDPITRSPTVEVAHEALIRTWARLREWLDSNRENLRLQRRLAVAATEWASSQHDTSFLASGARLAQFDEWSKTTKLSLNAEERTYLASSLAERDARQQAEETRKAHELTLERRSQTFLRALAVVLLVATIGALGLAGFALSQRQAAQENAISAEQAKTVAQQQADLATKNEKAAVAARTFADEQSGIARTSATRTQKLALAAGAQAALGKGNTDLALSLSITANGINQPVEQADLTLSEAAYAPGTERRFPGIKSGADGVAFSPDGKTGLSTSGDKTLILWDLATGEQIRTFEGHEAAPISIAFNADGTRVLSGGKDNAMILWDVATGKPITTFKGHEQDVFGVAWSPDEKTAVSASGDTTLVLWDLATGNQIRRFQGHTQIVRAVAFSPDGKTILSGSQDTSLILWDVATGQPIRTFQKHTGAVNGVDIAPDGKTAASASSDGTIILWDLATGEPLRTFRGHTRDVYSVRFDSTGRHLISGSRDTRIGLWDVTTDAPIRLLSGHGGSVEDAVWGPDDQHVLSGSLDGSMRLWSLVSGAQVRTFIGHTQRVIRTAFSPDGHMFASGSGDGTVILWDVATGKPIRSLAGHNGAVSDVGFSPDSKKVLSSSSDKTLILWDVATGNVLHLLEGHTDEVSAAAYSPDGKTVVSGSADKLLIIWDADSGKELRRLKGHTEKINGVAYSPDSSMIISASRDKTLMLWDVATGEPIRTMKGHTANVRAVAFSPDGKTVLSGSEDNILILWDVATGKPIRSFTEHTSSVWDIAYNPDGKTVASGSEDNTVIVWNIETGQAIRRFTGHTAAVRDVDYSPDGKTLLSGSNDMTLILWRLDTDAELVSWVHANRFVPDLNCDQVKRYSLDQQCKDSDNVP